MARKYFIQSQNSIHDQDHKYSVLSTNGSEIEIDFISFNENKKLPEGALTFSDRKTARDFMESLEESTGRVFRLESLKEIA
ncbi:hypothetical protein [Thiothrix sp.]|jgi:hypothetical protein|uniref:hypothetical protein n=1 Tax=Thiothrix sp. TaxID=1032 RepID=UPI00257FAD8C|nr:hypothetical protein [Thiothrix sp.]